ncbi:spore germination protein [Paenibacillus hexagrammi]|uniref:Spore germination protein n=1 Tax=Paenibacillus hexagrammi TaxID=2908839 RepID=A0ABY3SIB8_9BACL|nr:spore germination protein [Paenibacillus sp. YPD9-1]UJF33528.1 spore germination protein [Paenibacillus sp. YPD9-1]
MELHDSSMNSTIGNLSANEASLRSMFLHCDDVVFKKFSLQNAQEGLLVYTESLADEKRIVSDILKPLQGCSLPSSGNWDEKITWLLYQVLPVDNISIQILMEEAVDSVFNGNIMLLLDGFVGALLISMSSYETRSIEEPATEPVIRGPRDGFTEHLQTNISLIRRRLRTSQLKCEAMQIGSLSRTQVMIMYIDQIASPVLIEEVKRRVQQVKLKIVLESGYIEELIADNRLSIFPQVLPTERPDRTVAGLASGRVAILVDNTPFVLIAPTTPFEMLQAAEDYSQQYLVASVMRWLRMWLSFSALVFPSLYIALTTMHQEMLPTSLLLSIASSREAVPFPAIVEAFLMELAFEALREAGIRLPRPVGQAVSIVGALVIGQAAVQAGLVSASLVIVVSFTGIASFIFPSYSQGLSIRMLRFPLMIFAGALGLYGILLALLALLIHLLKLQSFGVPYLSPTSPLHVKGLKDVLFRVPWWSRYKDNKLSEAKKGGPAS